MLIREDRHNARIHDPQVLHAIHFQGAVNNPAIAVQFHCAGARGMPYGNGGVSNVTSSLNQNFVDGDGDERGVLENVLHPLDPGC